MATVFANFLPAEHSLSPSAVLLLDLSVIIASLLPDLIDKPLYLLKLTGGTRTYGHTILVSAFVCAAVYISLLQFWTTIEYPEGWTYAVVVGIASHLVADSFFGYVPLLYPLQGFRTISMVHNLNTRSKMRWLEALGCLNIVLLSRAPQYIGWPLFTGACTVFVLVLVVQTK
jgi:membrane-bound metal-dependent hydrolase YbcI (DUF457 family)